MIRHTCSDLDAVTSELNSRPRMTALGTVLALGIGLPLTAGVTPAYAQAQLSVTKTHTGDFARGGQGVYRVTVTNTGDESTPGATVLVDNLPEGLTVTALDIVSTDTGLVCNGGPGGQSFQCESGALFPGGS
ncbi:hypothetical protein NFX46_21550 [Streptomyces phaeoluteigriseus]|uniref:DUF11 domain-containing protein n=1 Tax=Streptomyces phaeoluteigriseus TaxID=114686 RepID=A0ABY4ZAK3_9ACTN|nr:hypothetical protein [Streptomyces phaeoluteigriseus]USQ86069.1 hypothetical protein NFX46_21550 [Streptomyces phaeoluteigriseus]